MPPNVTATLTVAAGDRGGLTEGGSPIDRARGVRVLGLEGGTARIELDAGTYRVRSAVVT